MGNSFRAQAAAGSSVTVCPSSWRRADESSSHFEPLRARPDRRLPADWSLPGHPPAQLARCPAVGKTVMSIPISATMTSAVRCATPVRLPASLPPAVISVLRPGTRDEIGVSRQPTNPRPFHPPAGARMAGQLERNADHVLAVTRSPVRRTEGGDQKQPRGLSRFVTLAVGKDPHHARRP
jgi:hypothetical protein